jgi:tetratricopeptide (TPR) repeat protein
MMKLGRLEEAVSWFEQGLEIKPEDRTLNHNLARALLRLDRFDQALEHYRRALGPDGQTENAELMNDLGLAYFGLDKTDSALRWLNRAIQARPDWDDPLFNLGQVFAGLGRTDRAVACFERLMERHRPSEPAWRKYALGRARALTRGGRLEPAQRAYESLIKRAGPAPEPLAELGTVLLLRGQAPRGLSALREAYRLTPNDFRMLRRIAWVRATCPDPQIRSAREALRLGQSAYEQASRLAQSVESDRPGRDASALLYPFQDTLAAALAEAGRFEDAADLAQQAAEAAERAGKPDHQRIILQRLEAYRAKRAVRVAGPAFHPELTPPTASQAPPLAPAPAPAP